MERSPQSVTTMLFCFNHFFPIFWWCKQREKTMLKERLWLRAIEILPPILTHPHPSLCLYLRNILFPHSFNRWTFIWIYKSFCYANSVLALLESPHLHIKLVSFLHSVEIYSSSFFFFDSEGGNQGTQGLRDQEHCLKKPHAFIVLFRWDQVRSGYGWMI